MRTLKIIILFVIVLSGCSEKYVVPSEQELLGENFVGSWKKLEVKVIEQDEKTFYLNCQVKDLVGIRDSVNLSIFEQKDEVRRKKTNGLGKAFTGCVIGGCAVLASAATMYSYGVDHPSEEIYPILAACYGVVGGITSLYFISSGLKEFFESDRAKPYYIKKNIICRNSTPLRDDEVRIILKNTNSEKIYNTDRKGNLDFKINEIIPEPAEADSVLELIIRYYELVDTVKVRRL